MKLYRSIPTTVYSNNIPLLRTPDIIEGFKLFLKHGDNTSLNVTIILKRRELISTYKEKIELAFKSHIEEIMKILKERGYNQFGNQTDFLLFIRDMVDNISQNIDDVYEVELENDSKVLKVVQQCDVSHICRPKLWC